MPRNGSGGYSRATPGTPYVVNTTIDETVVNSEMDDLGNEIANSLAKDGQTVPTANLPMGGYRHTGVGAASALTHYPAVSQVQNSAFCYGASGGTADAITLTLSPAPAAYASGQLFAFLAAADNTGAATLNVNSLGAKNVKRDVSVALQAGDIANGGVSFVEYDGTNFQLLNPRTVVTQSTGNNSTKPASTAYVDAVSTKASVRQTVLYASVGAVGGQADYITIGTGLSVNIAATSENIVLTAANGENALGSNDRVGVISADTTIGSLTANDTCYLYADIAANGTVTLGHSILAPLYRFEDTYITTNEQFTFSIQNMRGTVGNGTTAVQTYRVFIGEAVTNGTNVTSVVNYALRGRAYIYDANITVNTAYDYAHNIGADYIDYTVYYRESSSFKWCEMPSFVEYLAPFNVGLLHGIKDSNTIRLETATNYITRALAAGTINTNNTFFTGGTPQTSGDILIVANRVW